ncbi:MAG: double zinc ribbon [Firmicutes bacterium]|nr:double zinc ribbon [Bacillota bacterium]
MQCPTCKKLIQGEFKFCPHCGAKTNVVCSGCGKEMMPDWVACPYCGLGAKVAAPLYPPQHPSHHQTYHSNSSSSGHRNKRKKGLLGNFFSS